MRTDDLQADRLLELVFVDVGQGDGCLLVTPEDKHIVIDAGVGDNMYRFLKWRYGGFRTAWTFESAIITHPDQDHYYGFQKLFEEQNVSFETVYHNGIMEERTPGRPLGPTETDGPAKYLTGIIEDSADLQAFLNQTHRWRHPSNSRYDKRYPTLLNTAFTSGRVNDIRMASVSHSNGGYLPGYGPADPLQIGVLSPIVEPDAHNNTRLRVFMPLPDVGKLTLSLELRLVTLREYVRLSGVPYTTAWARASQGRIPGSPVEIASMFVVGG